MAFLILARLCRISLGRQLVFLIVVRLCRWCCCFWRSNSTDTRAPEHAAEEPTGIAAAGIAATGISFWRSNSTGTRAPEHAAEEPTGIAAADIVATGITAPVAIPVTEAPASFDPVAPCWDDRVECFDSAVLHWHTEHTRDRHAEVVGGAHTYRARVGTAEHAIAPRSRTGDSVRCGSFFRGGAQVARVLLLLHVRLGGGEN
jgi:hypothetical protein